MKARTTWEETKATQLLDTARQYVSFFSKLTKNSEKFVAAFDAAVAKSDAKDIIASLGNGTLEPHQGKGCLGDYAISTLKKEGLELTLQSVFTHAKFGQHYSAAFNTIKSLVVWKSK